MAGLLSLLPAGLKGVGRFVGGLARGESPVKAIGEGVASGLGAIFPSANNMLPTTSDVDRMKRMPMKYTSRIVNVGGNPERRVEPMPIRESVRASITETEDDDDDDEDKVDKMIKKIIKKYGHTDKLKKHMMKEVAKMGGDIDKKMKWVSLYM